MGSSDVTANKNDDVAGTVCGRVFTRRQNSLHMQDQRDFIDVLAIVGFDRTQWEHEAIRWKDAAVVESRPLTARAIVTGGDGR